MKNWKERYIGSKEFYGYVIAIALPMIIQNLITNFVSMLDNIMVGQVGTLQMSGVSIVNQFIFVFNLTIFGAISGASIFGTQFFGKKDGEGQKYTFRYRLIFVSALILLGMIIFVVFQEPLINLFLSKDDSPELVAQTLAYGKQYLRIMVWCFIPFGIGQAYSSVVRECGETRIPMYGSMAAIGINLFLDYGLIFGKFGLPEMGVAGAAIATLIAKCVEALVVIFWAHTHLERNPYLPGAFTHFWHIPKELMGKIIIKSLPLMINEFLWALGMAMVSQCYSVRGLDVVAARNIASTITNLFSVFFVQLGGAIGIIVGNRLGAGDFKKAREHVEQLMLFVIVTTVIIAVLMVPFAVIFPKVYQTEEHIKILASWFIAIQAFTMPFASYANMSYFVLRSGGKILITFIFDSTYTWLLMIPLAFFLTRFTAMDVRMILLLVTGSELFKSIIGHILMRSDLWVNNIVNE